MVCLVFTVQTLHFPSLRSPLAALSRHTTEYFRRYSLPELEECVETYLPAHLLSAEEEGANSRERIYSLRLTFQCFVWQMLKPKTSCKEVVRQVQALFRLRGLGKVKKGTSGYSQARSRLPKERLEKALRHLSQEADRRVGAGGYLGKRPVKVADVTGIQLADTPANQRRYPQSSQQKKGCGFPWMKLLVLFSLSSGAIMQVAMGNRHHHDLRLLRQLWDQLKRGDILLGDRAYSDYATLAELLSRGIDVAARLNAKRKVDFRKAKRLGRNDGLFVWTKPQTCPPYLRRAHWRRVSATLTVRIVRFQVATKGYRTRRVTLVTTLLDPKLYPLEELAALYARRWRLELCLRDVKTQMGMEQIRAKSPEMAQKEVLAYLVAHNLIRCLMAQAAARYQVDLERLSFKGTIDSLRQFAHAMAQTSLRKMQQQLWEDLLEIIATDLVPSRPARREPRAVKRRPKQFPFLLVPRRQFKDPIPYRKWKRLKAA
jgi:hypothetical protein